MNSKFLSALLLVFSAILSGMTYSYAQVTVGTGLEPANGALIDFKEKAVDPATFDNSTKGVLFPKVILVAQDTLKPVIPGVATAQDSLLSTGMVVYNVAGTVGNGEGLYVWNGKQWFPLFGNSSGYATFQIPFNCSSLNVGGTYAKGEPLVATTNYIDINVTVVNPGTYNAVAVPDGTGNGYYFSASGTFKMAGTYTIRLAGMGTPTNSNDPGDPTTWDNFQLSINGVDMCTASIQVQTVPVNYQLICSSILINGTYSVGTPLTSSNTITLSVTSSQSAAGSPYVITTESLNGFSFSASGVLSGGTQNVVLSGQGTPLESQQTYFTITTNSTNPNAYCNALVPVAARNIKIYSFGGYWYNLSATETDTGVTYHMLHNPALFGSSTATYPIAGFTQYPSPTTGISSPNPTAAGLENYINTNHPDIITGGYEWGDASGASAAEAVAIARVLAQYVRQGGVLIYCNDIPPSDVKGSYVVSHSLLDSIFNNQNLTLSGGSDGPDTVPIVAGFPPIINGLFMNLAGTNVQRDGANNGYVVGADPNMVPIAENNIGARAVVHKNLGFFFSGDGGIFTGSVTNLTTTNFPAKATSSGSGSSYICSPMVFTTNNSTNSFLFCNVMVWAINKAQQNRPTGNEPFNIVLP